MGKQRFLSGVVWGQYSPFSLSKVLNLFIELLVVFFGVYAAFLLTNYHDEEKTQIQREKIMVSLKSELEYMRTFYPAQQTYQKKKVSEWTNKLDSNLIVDFYQWRYVQPQYNYMVVEYAIDSREIGVIDFNLHQKLLAVYQGLKQVEYAEEKMTLLALEYQPISSEMADNVLSYQLAIKRNRFLFNRFKTFANDRANILGHIAQAANEALKFINQNFSPQELRRIEKEMMIEIFTKSSESTNPTEMRAYIQKMFPQMSQEDLNEIIEKVNKARD